MLFREEFSAKHGQIPRGIYSSSNIFIVTVDDDFTDRM